MEQTDKVICSKTILTGMSHEMRTYMNSIVAFSFLLQENSVNHADKKEFSNQIFSSCQQMMQLFDSFLDTAKIETGNSQTKLKVCRLDNLIDDIIAEAREAVRKEDEKKVEVLTDFHINDSLRAIIDIKLINRAVRSLFQNSLKNTTAGYIKIGLTNTDDMLTFSVHDTGKSYDKFREFLDSDDINKSLALHDDVCSAINIILVKKIVRMLGGTIWIERNDAEGAVIYFSLPAKFLNLKNTGIADHTHHSRIMM
jgi:two-component system sensor histidine kinase BarA